MENNSDASQHIKGEDDHALLMTKSKDPLFNSIDGMLTRLPPQSVECCIYRVPLRLRKINEEAYTPQTVSIGPFHRGKKHLQAMEEVKMRHLQTFLSRSFHGLELFLQTVRTWEQKVRACYSENFDDLSSDEFVRMILVDGSFVVELLLGTQIIDKHWIRSHVAIDMMLLENQLPFFVLDDLFSLALSKNPTFLLKMAHKFFKDYSRVDELPDRISFLGVKHFVDFIHQCHLSTLPEPLVLEVAQEPEEGSSSSSTAQSSWPCFLWLFPQVEHTGHGFGYPPTVRRLHEAGIELKKGTSISLFDIKFTNGILEIPQLVIDDWTGTVFQNLAAFEMCHNARTTAIADYFSLLDNMITSTKDVDLLIEDEIIKSALSTSEDVSTLFANIGKEVIVPGTYFCFSNLCQQLNAYCKSPWHKWKATLRHDYFSSPWAAMSLIAAVVLLVLTFITTICSVLALK